MVRTTSVVILALAVSLVGSTAEADDDSVAGIRTDDPTIRQALNRGRRLSPTFAGILERVTDLKGIVYITRGSCGKRTGACLLHRIERADPYRYLFIQLDIRRLGDRLIPAIGHELVHALETLRAPGGLDTSAGMYYYFDRIGTRAADHLAFETEAAQTATLDISRELGRAARDDEQQLVMATR